MLREIKDNFSHYFIDEKSRRQGEYKDYRINNGQLWEHSFFLNNERHGEFKIYQENGQLGRHSFYQHGNIHGESKSYHENGHLYIHSFYIHGRCEGETKIYYDNDKLNEHYFYQNDMRHGEYRRYRKNGQLNHATYFYQGTDLKVDPATLTEKDILYIMMSGRLPPRD